MLSEKPWNPEGVLIFLLGVFGSMILGMFLLGGLQWAELVPGPQSKLVSILIGTLSFHGASLILIVPFLRRHQLTWSEAFGFRSPKLARALTWGFLSSIGALPVAWLLGKLSSQLLTSYKIDVSLQMQVQLLVEKPTIAVQVAVALITVFLAPVAEELFFRGILYPAVKRMAHPQIALWGSSFLFACMHNNVMLFVPLLFLGMVLALLYEATDNLLAPILAHSLFNSANLALLLLFPQSVQSP